MSNRRARRDTRQEQQNDPPLLIMTSLAEGPKHGYALIADIESFAGVTLGPGTLYGAIGRLEERGLIEPAAPAGRARPYRLTGAGRASLEGRLADLSAIVGEGRARLEAAPATARGSRGRLARGAAPALGRTA
ncbi:MAG: PadR family transcriptional regulator [Solirubrobacteraceae bacterium]